MAESTRVMEAWMRARVDGNADAIAALYESDAIFVVTSAGIVARGRPAIRDAWVDLIAGSPVDRIELIERDEVVDGDHAYAHQHGFLRGQVDGDEVEIPFCTTEIMHRGADDIWRYIVDHA